MNTTTLQTEVATTKDIEALIALLGILFEQEAEFSPCSALQRQGLEKIIQNPQIGEIMVIRNQYQVIGMTTLLYTISTSLGSKVALLEDMVINPRYRNKGAGSHLLHKVIEHAKAVGCQRITLLTDGDNQAAHQFYMRNGFTASQMRVYRMLLTT
jgi:GNAT superfamily N-acetyltransferase